MGFGRAMISQDVEFKLFTARKAQIGRLEKQAVVLSPLVLQYRAPPWAYKGPTCPALQSCHDLTQLCQCDSQKKTRNTTRMKCCACHAFRFESAAPVTQNDFRHVMQHVGMSRSAMPATRNEVTQRLKPHKVTAFAALPIGTAIASSPRTVANSCRRKSSVERTQLHPQTPKVKREPFAMHSGKYLY